MGVVTYAKAFTEDVLRVELFGPSQAQLTLVDLPGLIQSENKQQSAADVLLVSSLVQSYMPSLRGVILAVVSAEERLRKPERHQSLCVNTTLKVYEHSAP